jgi:hypothetical protein
VASSFSSASLVFVAVFAATDRDQRGPHPISTIVLADEFGGGMLKR